MNKKEKERYAAVIEENGKIRIIERFRLKTAAVMNLNKFRGSKIIKLK